MAGFYVPEANATVGARFTPVAPARVGDSRSAGGGLVTFSIATSPRI